MKSIWLKKGKAKDSNEINSFSQLLNVMKGLE
jgi:hypothetical protein